MGMKILVYNNNMGIAERISPLLAGTNLTVVTACNMEQLYLALKNDRIILMLVDAELNDKGFSRGLEVIATLRKASSVPLIVISAQSAETAKIMALDAGADDFVTAECNPLELLARMKSHMRRYTQLTEMRVNINCNDRVDDLVFDDLQQIVTVGERPVHLTPTEYKILRLLVKHRGNPLSKSQIYESIWHMRAIDADNIIAVHIRHIREKIENNPKDPKYLKAVWGYGYKVG